ncbi:DNA-binding protein [Pleionea sp. CnH1-48]|uniref:DNA-binding protein n=1 Tax=Pleionea sp. CnH1-48 TaxID=2954494 RepID=UPI00209827AB|nr:DNA-binding protein [Pleionea sp. CnH1-48]MCO7227545.1 DNA-binding protein [Pleionea sp. CnH1-48]
MARPGVSYEEAKQVFTSILIQGESLSIQRARESFGSGSNSTWQQHLAKFRKEQKGKSIRRLPESFPEELVPMFEQLWVKANEAAEHRFEQEKAQSKDRENTYKAEISELELRIKKLHEDLANAQETIEALTEAHAHLEHALNQKEQQFIRINTKNNAQIESLIDKNKELLKLLDEQKELNKTLVLKHERATTALESKHSNDIRRLETSEAKWISLYDESKQNEKQINGKLERVSRENSELKSIEKRKIQVEASLLNSEQQIEKLETKITQSESMHNQLLRNNESLKIQLKTANESNAKLLSENTELTSKLVEEKQEATQLKKSSL